VWLRGWYIDAVVFAFDCELSWKPGRKKGEQAGKQAAQEGNGSWD
jgi:hypothetical protein